MMSEALEKCMFGNLLGLCLCFLKRLCLNAGGGRGGGAGAGMLSQLDKKEG